MALNLKNPEVEKLAAEIATIAHESKTEAIRKALSERRARLLSKPRHQKRGQRVAGLLEEFRSTLPRRLLGKRLAREEEDEILGFGPGGV